MITSSLLGLIVGLLGNIAPLFFTYLQSKMEIDKQIKLKELEHALAQQRIEMESKNLAAQTDIAELLATLREGESLRNHDASIDDDSVVGVVRALVRPVITLVLFGFFIAVKVALLIHLMTVENLDFVTAGNVLLDENTMAMISAVFAFWFGARPVEKFMKRVQRK